MKKNMVQTVLILFFCVMSLSVEAYQWRMLSRINKPLLVQVELLHSKNPYFVLVQPNEYADFSWPAGNAMAGFCLGAVKYVMPDEALLNDTSIIKNKKTVADNAKMLQWLEQHKDKYPRITADVELTAPQGSGVQNGSIAKLGCTSRDNIVIAQEGDKITFKAPYSATELTLSKGVQSAKK